MHDIRTVREDGAGFDAALARRGHGPVAGALLRLDDARKMAIAASESNATRRNALSRAFGAAKARDDMDGAERLQAEAALARAAAPGLDGTVREAEAALRDALLAIPNLPAREVPDGTDEHANVEIRRWGDPCPAGGDRSRHEDIRAVAGLMDFEAGAAISGSRFVVLKGQVARLHRALGQYMLDMHVDRHGFTEVDPPYLVRAEALVGTAQFPKFVDDQFPAGEGRWLIPTAEVPLTNLVRDAVVDGAVLPVRLAALTPCFRSEAGAAGRDNRGILRQHQFHKVEMVSVTTPELSAGEHAHIVACAEAVLQGLGIPYRVMALCCGDMGFASRRTHDIEAWMPGQGAYREISSVSECGDFQARRMGARYRPRDGGAPRHLHTLNGSGVAVGRALAAVLENHQRPDGTVSVPAVLLPYTGGLQVIG